MTKTKSEMKHVVGRIRAKKDGYVAGLRGAPPMTCPYTRKDYARAWLDAYAVGEKDRISEKNTEDRGGV